MKVTLKKRWKYRGPSRCFLPSYCRDMEEGKSVLLRNIEEWAKGIWRRHRRIEKSINDNHIKNKVMRNGE